MSLWKVLEVHIKRKKRCCIELLKDIQNPETKRQPYRNLIGKKFNMLTVVSFSHYSKTGYPYWNCLCDCGSEKAIDEHNLLSGQTKSCGCLKSLRGKNLRTEKLTVYDGVEIGSAIAQTTKKSNTSGFRGVSWVEKSQKWRVNLSFRGVRYHLGYFKYFNDAIQARLDGEVMVREFVENYLNTMTEQSDDEKATKMKQAFENNLRAKEKAQADFKRNVCKGQEHAFISQKTTVFGEIEIEGNLLIGGEVKGDVKCTKSLMINGKITGNVTADIVYIPTGKVVGDVMATQIYCSNVIEQISGNTTGKVSPYTRIERKQDK